MGGFAHDAGVLAEEDLRAALRGAFTELAGLLEEIVRHGREDGSLPAVLDPRRTAAALVADVDLRV